MLIPISVVVRHGFDPTDPAISVPLDTVPVDMTLYLDFPTDE